MDRELVRLYTNLKKTSTSKKQYTDAFPQPSQPTSNQQTLAA